jgi:TonB family protein
LGSGWGTFLTGAVLAMAGQFGLGTVLLLAGLGIGIWGNIRRKDESRSPNFSLGEASEADLHLAHPAIPASCFPLVQSTATGHLFNFTQQMSGDVTLGASRVDLGDLVATGQARPSNEYSGAYAYSIPRDARIKVDVGDSTFLVNSVPPAHEVANTLIGRVDWSSQGFNGASVGIHALVLLLVVLVPPDTRVLSLDAFNKDSKTIPVLIKAPKINEDEVPPWLKAQREAAKGPEGKAHKGESGKAGDPKSKQRNRRMAIKGPKDNPDPALSRHLAEQTVKQTYLVGLLNGRSGSRIASIFGRDSALGDEAEEALGNLIGNDVGDAYGMGGLGLIGTGRYGGGLGEGTVGTSRHLGTIGKGGQNGTADYGRGVGPKLRKRVASTPKIARSVKVVGALDKSIIRRIIRRHINEVKFCYQSELQSSPDLSGRVVVKFSISPTGQVAFSKVQTSTMGNVKVETCLTTAVRRWLFPKPQNGGIVLVSYPFIFRPVGSG